MNTGVYGTVRAANINIANDVEMFYYYKPTRGSESGDFSEGYLTLNPEECLVPSSVKTSTGSTRLFGAYELRLPLDKFNQKGIYTIYIRPKEIETTLADVSVLASYPNIKGIVVTTAGLTDTDLTGYRVEYIDSNGERMDTVRIITSCNRAEPILVTVTDQYPKVTRWILKDDSSEFLFCTVTPSAANSFNANSEPFIGTAGQKVILTNTKFNPLMVEIEMTDHDFDTITNMLEGDQVRDRDNGLITTYDSNKSIYQQYSYYTLKDSLNHPLYDVKRKVDVPDSSQEWSKIIIPNQQ